MSESNHTERTRTYSWEDPLQAAKAAQRLSGLDFFRAIQRGEVPVPPVMKTLEFEGMEFDEGRVVFSFIPQEYHYNPIGTVHGGIIATLCDSALGCAVHTTLPLGAGYSTIEIKVNYVKAMTQDVGRVYCEGKVIQVGGRIATAEARVVDAKGTLYSHATTTCIIFRPAKGDKA